MPTVYVVVTANETYHILYFIRAHDLIGHLKLITKTLKKTAKSIEISRILNNKNSSQGGWKKFQLNLRTKIL
jgi:hypothetical protein